MELPKKIAFFLTTMPPRFLLWAPVWLMFGIWAYFTLPSEPPLWLCAAIIAPAALILALAWRGRFRMLATILFLIALGFTAAQVRAWRAATPLLSHQLDFAIVEGRIDEIEPFEEKTKLVIAHPVIEGLTPGETPRRIRVSFRGNDPDWQVGDHIRFLATLYPLPRPAMPGSYDFARHFYFRSIGGNGFAMKPPEIVENGQHSGFAVWLNNLRHFIGDDMRAHIPGATGAVAAAMTVGETGPIPEDIKTDLRDAGLAHMLAIAGLHLGIVAGIVFFTVRLLLSLIPTFALRLPIKKIAGLCALATACIYLLLAGRPIPAQRAFIMVSFLFTAMLIDRKGITLRSLAIACMLILLLFPEAMFGASFQLSFAATLAIVALFEHFGRQLRTGGGFLHHVRNEVLGIAATSLVATLATVPFVLYHFNRFAVFGLIANMIVIPLATFVIMPGMLLSLLLMPLGLQWIGYAPLAVGTDWMLHMAHWVTALPGAALHFYAPTDWGLLLCAFGIMWICLRQNKFRLLGIPMLLLGLATTFLQRPYDVLVSEEGTKIMLRLEDGRFLFVRGRPDSFDGQVWLRYHGQEDGLKLSDVGDDIANCDKEYCTVSLRGHRIDAARRKNALGLCENKPDIAITSDVLPGQCSASLKLDREYLSQFGPVGLRFSGQGIELEKSVTGPGQRVWNMQSPLYHSNETAITEP